MKGSHYEKRFALVFYFSILLQIACLHLSCEIFDSVRISQIDTNLEMDNEHTMKVQASSRLTYFFNHSDRAFFLTGDFSNAMVQTSVTAELPIAIEGLLCRASDDPVNVHMQLARGTTQGVDEVVAVARSSLDEAVVQSLVLETWMEACTTTAAVKEVFAIITHMEKKVDNGVTFMIWCGGVQLGKRTAWYGHGIRG
jgi:hypothetical protein